MTSAQPSGPSPQTPTLTAPPHSITVAPQLTPAPKAPSSTRAPWRQPAGALGLGERQRDRRRRGVAELGDRVDHPLRHEPEPFADRAQDPRVGLVVDEEVDVVERQPRQGDRLGGRGGHQVDGVAEGLVALHLDHQLVAVDLDQVGLGAVGAQDDRADPALQGAAHEDGAGAVGEDGGGPTIARVGEGHHQVGADHQNIDGAAGFDLPAGDRDGAEEAGAGRVDVVTGGLGGAEGVGDARRGGRHQLLVGGGGDDDQVDVGGGDARFGKRLGARGGGELEEPFAGLGGAALFDPGPFDDPFGVDAELLGDRRVGDDRRGQGGADADHLGAAADQRRRGDGARGGGSGDGLRHRPFPWRCRACGSRPPRRGYDGRGR